MSLVLFCILWHLVAVLLLDFFVLFILILLKYSPLKNNFFGGGKVKEFPDSLKLGEDQKPLKIP